MTLTDRILYAPVSAMLWLAARLPFALLYPIADFIAWLARDVLKYRKRLVIENIGRCFPEMTEKELNKNVRLFYRHLADYFVETIKLTSMSDSEIKRRFTFSGVKQIDELLSQGKDIVLYTGHFANWEWVTSLSLWGQTPDVIYSHVYQPLHNAWFDNYFLKLRNRYSRSIARNNILRRLVEWRKTDKQFITGFLSDQRPKKYSSNTEVDFLGRKTHFIKGTEELARKLKTAVVWADTRIVKRGFYHTDMVIVTEDASQTSENWLTMRYAELLSRSIKRSPWAYLWSHNRWKNEKY